MVAANLLVDRGWDVLVLEAAPTPGGAVRSEELIEPGYVNDVFSAFYPMALASPAIRNLHLEQYGLNWKRVVVLSSGRDGTHHLDEPRRDAAASTRFISATMRSGSGRAWQVHRFARRVVRADSPGARPPSPGRCTDGRCACSRAVASPTPPATLRLRASATTVAGSMRRPTPESESGFSAGRSAAWARRARPEGGAGR